MSTERGNVARTRAQKYKNRSVYKNDLHDKTVMQKKLNSLHISEVCQHCKGVIEWKIKYKKYKPLTQPKTCTKCQQRNIRHAYHVLCGSCARLAQVCAKCLKSANDVDIEPAVASPEEQIKLKAEMDRLIKTLPERKRRSFLRYMEKGKQIETSSDPPDNVDDDDDEIDDSEEEFIESETKMKNRIPHTRDELLLKIEQLKLSDRNEEALNDCKSNETDSDNDV